MRKKNDALHDKLLNYARELAHIQGIEAVNIRSIAKRAGVATGTVYNYFKSKDEILFALTEEYWKNTLMEMRNAITSDTFSGQLKEIYQFLRSRIDSSAGILMHSLGNMESAGRERMEAMQAALGQEIIHQMELDANVRRDIWDETFTREQYARFLMMNMTMLLRGREPDIDFFLMIVKRTIY